MATTTFDDQRPTTTLPSGSRADFATLDFVAFAAAAVMVLGPLLFGALGGS